MSDAAQRLDGQFLAQLMVFGIGNDNEYGDMLLIAEVTEVVGGFTEIAFDFGRRRYYLRFRVSALTQAYADKS